jgi:penicillin V acylase-like amidase (Ntn superfamily)
MNRHGVAVADMSVDGVKAPYDSTKSNILHSTAMRLILDYAKSTDEAIELLQAFNVHFVATTCHLLIADATGKSAVVEFFDGRMQVTTTDECWQVCTNHAIAGKTEAANDECCDRYRLASNKLAELSKPANASDVMNIMASVSKENWTMWTSLYELTRGEFRLAYRRHYDNLYVGGLNAAE